MVIPRRRLTITRISSFAVAASLLGLTLDGTLFAFNYVVDVNGTYWGIQDAASPGVDTGSIRATQIAPAGTAGIFSTQINGFGGIKVLVETKRPPRFNGELMRGFGLAFDGVDRFATMTSVGLGGVTISRSVYVNRSANYGRWLDSFTNTTDKTLRIRVAFGGQSGIGTAAVSTTVVNTSSGDTLVTAEDSWVEVATPLAGSAPVGGPQITVVGTPSTPAKPFSGAMTFAGNWLLDSFEDPLVYTGHEANFQAYVNTLTIPAGKSRSLLHFVVLGPRVDATTSAAERAEIEEAAKNLVNAPDISGLTTAEVCTIRNFDVDALTASGFDYDRCSRSRGRRVDVVAQAPVPRAPKPVTTSDYDVVEKTIGDLRRDMQRGRTTSQEITRAYLDRIAVYDKGQFGFHAYEIVAADAMKQARAADRARARGAHGPLLGIPIAIKNNYDTFDMPTTNGSFTFEGFLPARDAFQVARLREAGAVIIGKAALEEYATFGHWSNDAWGQVWNVHLPSKSPLASSGGSAAAVAGSFAAAAMGSQTGDSLYAPASGASLVTLRGTDGLESGTGIQPLVWMTDFGGAITRSVSDLADVLNIVTGIDPEDPATLARPPGAVPADWRTALDPNALQGKRIGYVDAFWADVFGPTIPPFGTNGTIDAMKNALQYLEKAGATIVQMGQLATPPTPDQPLPFPIVSPIPGNRITAEGWRQYIDKHPELVTQGFSISTEVEVNCSQKKVLYVRAAPETCLVAPLDRLTPAEIQQHRDFRQITRPASVKQWMDDAKVDAVVYPGLLSDISLNDGGGGGMGKVAFGRRDTPSAGNGVPTIAIPAGANANGQPVNIQLMGRAWDDARLVGFAYAFERLANAAGNGHVRATTVPPLRRVHDDDDDDDDRRERSRNDDDDDDWDRWRKQ